MAIAMMIGILSSGFISDKFGIKLCLIFGCVIQTIGWAMLYFAPDFLVLMSGRIITGIGSGICSPASYVILSEYALVRYRGEALLGIGLNLGSHWLKIMLHLI